MPHISTAMSTLAAALASLEASERPGLGNSVRRKRIEDALSKLADASRDLDHGKDLARCKAGEVQALAAHISLLLQDHLDKKTRFFIAEDLKQMIDTAVYQCKSGWPTQASTDALSSVVTGLATPLKGNDGDLTLQLLRTFSDHCGRVVVAGDIALVPFRLESGLFVCEAVFKKALKLHEAGKWGPCRGIIQGEEALLDVLVELEELYERLLPFEKLRTAVAAGYEPGRARMTRHDFRMYSDMCQASLLLHTGDQHYQTAVQGDPDDLFARMQLAQDDYRLALVCVEGHDLELEGTILCRIARFYADVTKMAGNAHDLYLRAIQLAGALAPAQPKGGWYAEAKRRVQARRQKLEAEEAKKWHRRREPILGGLRPEIAKLDGKRSLSNRDFCLVCLVPCHVSQLGRQRTDEDDSSSFPSSRPKSSLALATFLKASHLSARWSRFVLPADGQDRP